MPNTLAHFAINGLFTRTLISQADFKWIYLACVIPDIPWILQRAVKTFPITLDLYDLRAFCIAQSSFLLCVFICGALAMLAKQRGKVFIILIIGCLLHLLLDAVQIKWANGVQLFAPFDWGLIRFDIFWPESLGTYVLTVAGVLYFLINIKKTVKPNCEEFQLNLITVSISAVLLLIWLSLPLVFIQSVYSADNHYIATLKDSTNRMGKEIEIDRNTYVVEGGVSKLKTSFGESILLKNIEAESGEKISLQGRFVDQNTIYVKRFHKHAKYRDYASMLGLSCVIFIWIVFISRCYLIYLKQH